MQLFVQKRRDFLKAGDQDGYFQQIYEESVEKERITTLATDVLIEHYDIDHDFFVQSYEKAFRNTELYDNAMKSIQEYKVNMRLNYADQLEKEGVSPRTVVLIRPRNLTEQEAKVIF